MTAPKEHKESLNDATKAEILHQYKLSLVRECMIYGKSLKEVQAYFASKGLKISKRSWNYYKEELKSHKSAKNWFSKEALYVMEEDHMLSVERARTHEDKIVNIMNNLMSNDEFDTKVHYDTSDKGVKVRVENYNTELFLKCNDGWMKLQEIKSKMFSATPMVQEMMEVHEQQQAESQRPSVPGMVTKE